jgi:origin recognition complex subunit 2
MGDATSDDEERDETIAREIYESSGAEDDSAEEDVDAELAEDSAAVTDTPSKTPARRKRATRKRSPTPPRDLPPHEQYFYQNKPGLTKTSNNNLSSLDLLTHDEYFTVLRKLQDPHAEEIRSLQSIHAGNFLQWAFELSQGFSICLYGYGSKRSLLREFATHLYSKTQDHTHSRIVVVNGYVRTTSTREILTTIGSAIDSSQKIASGNPMTMLQNLLSLLSSHETIVTLVINSVDALPLRKQGIQSILAQLAAHPQIRLVCSADTPDFSLLWDSGLRSSFNFVFHNGTTFAPFTAEIDVVDEVHELLGRKARRVGGKEGVSFVLRSLPENAKNLFRLLVTEVLVAMDDGSGASAEGTGVEYRMLYNKAVEEFICSSEMAFRTLLKE